MATDLVAFLNARLDEDEQIAREAGFGGYDEWAYNPKSPWNSDAGPREAVIRFHGSAMSYVAAVDPVHGKYGTWDAQHIARWDPARVLAEVAAKRRILEQYEAELAVQSHGMGGLLTKHLVPRLYDVVRLLALPYRDQPGYRPEWTPDAGS